MSRIFQCVTNNAQLKIILLPLKTKYDGAMPTYKEDFIAAYDRWKDRAPPIFAIVEREEVQANEVDCMCDELEANEVDLDYEGIDLQSCDM